jgi:hypothetical protein
MPKNLNILETESYQKREALERLQYSISNLEMYIGVNHPFQWGGTGPWSDTGCGFAVERMSLYGGQEDGRRQDVRGGGCEEVGKLGGGGVGGRQPFALIKRQPLTEAPPPF